MSRFGVGGPAGALHPFPGGGRFAVAFVVALFLLTSCATSLRLPGASSGRDGTTVDRFPERWRVEGRVSVRVGREAWSLGFAWCRGRGTEAIVFTDPFGRLRARLVMGQGRAVLERPGEEDVEALDGAALMKEVFGQSLPVASIPDWLMGRLSGRVERDGFGRIVHWTGSGWRLRYLDHGRWGGFDLPRLIHAENDGSSRIRLRLVVERWRFDEAGYGGCDA